MFIMKAPFIWIMSMVYDNSEFKLNHYLYLTQAAVLIKIKE